MKTRVGPYLIEKTLGRGGMGVVYQGSHEHLGRPVAIKALAPELTNQPEFKERFLAEAKTHARLHHPGIVLVYDLLEEAGEFFIVMEFVAGEMLDDRLRDLQGEGMEPAAALDLFGQMLAALDYAHSQGVIHRDIKPSNVLIAEGGRIKLLDFGIALLIGDHRLTASQSAIGTPVYMSPEQILRPRTVDHRSDIYSAAVVLYEMLAGAPPFDGDTEFGIKRQHVEAPPRDLAELLPGLPAALAAAVARALAKDPDDRFASAGLFQRELQAAPPSAGGAPTAGIAGWRRLGRAKKRWIAAAGGLAVATIGFAAQAWRGEEAAIPAEPAAEIASPAAPTHPDAPPRFAPNPPLLAAPAPSPTGPARSPEAAPALRSTAGRYSPPSAPSLPELPPQLPPGGRTPPRKNLGQLIERLHLLAEKADEAEDRANGKAPLTRKIEAFHGAADELRATYRSIFSQTAWSKLKKKLNKSEADRGAKEEAIRGGLADLDRRAAEITPERAALSAKTRDLWPQVLECLAQIRELAP